MAAPAASTVKWALPRMAAPVVVLLALLGALASRATPASADITTFTTSIISGTGRAVYQRTDPAPAAQVKLTFVSNTTGTTWVFGLSTDVQTTASGTVTFDPKSMINSNGSCTMCVVSKVSGPSTYLPNDVYVTSMSFLNTSGTTTTSANSSLSLSLFTMPATITPASSATAGDTLLTVSAKPPQSVKSDSTSPYTNAPRFLIAGTGACEGKLITIILANPAMSVDNTVTISYADPPVITAAGSLTFRGTPGGDALVRGCSYNVSFLYRSALLLPPLPSNAENAPFVTTTSTAVLIPNVPAAPTIGTATAGDGSASVSFTPGGNGGSTVTGYTVTADPGGITGTGTSSPITVSGLTNGTAYTFTVTATNAIGTGSASGASSSVTPLAAQTITFGNPGAQDLGTTPTLSATSSSGGAVAFTSSTPTVCTVTGDGALTLLAVGTCTIDADQPGDSTHAAATPVQQSFAVNAVVPGAPTVGTVTADDGSASVSFTPPAFDGGSTLTGYTVTASPGGITATGSSSPITVSGLTNGTAYTFTVSATNGVGTGAASGASSPVTPKSAVTPVVVTASSPTTAAYGTAAPAVGYTTSPVTTGSDWTAEPTCGYYAIADTSYSTALSGVLGVGTYTTHCSGGTSATHAVSSRVDGSFTVTKAPAVAVGVTASATSYTYGGTAPTLSFSAAGFVNDESFGTPGMTAPTCRAYAGSDVAFTIPVTLSSTTRAGSYLTHCSGGIVSTNYETPIGYTNGTLTIDKAMPDCAVTGYTVTFDGNAHTATGSCRGVDGAVLAGLDLTGTTHTNAGDYAGDAWSFTDVTGNYINVIGTVTDTISKASQSIQVLSSAPVSKSFGGTFTVAARASSGSSVSIATSGGCTGSGTDSVTVTMTSGTTTCSIGYGQAGNSNYVAAASVTETTTARKMATTVLYTGDQILTLPAALKVSAQTTGAPACAASGFALDRNPLTQASGSYPLVVVAGSVSTTGWLEGAYQMTVAYGGDSNCALATDWATVTVAGSGTAATGGGSYTLSGSGRINFGFTARSVPKTTPVQYKGEIVVINNGKWRLKGTVTSYAKTTTSGAIGGTGTLYWWDSALGGGLGDWALAATNVAYTASMTPTTSKTTPGSIGLKITYTPTGAQPATLPNSTPQTLKGGRITLA